MRTKSFLAALLLALIGPTCFRAAAASPSPASPLQRFDYTQPKMGTVFRLLIWAPDQDTADGAALAAWDKVDQLNRTLSDYDPQSELNRLSRMTDSGPMKQPVHVSDELWDLLVESIRAARLSNGAFDVTVGPLTRLQRQSRKTSRMPDPRQVRAAMKCIGWRYIQLFPNDHRVQLLHGKMQLDVGGIAKGFTSDQVLKVLRAHGISHALCGAAGDIAVGDPPPARPDWRIAIQSLRSPNKTSDYVRLRDQAISTSGDTYRSAIIKGKRYSHIIDPRTGLGLTHRIGVTTIAPHGVTADWSATAISILGPQKGLEMIERIDGAAARIVTLDDQGNPKVYESKQFARFLISNPTAPETSAPSANPVH